jgi:hypothetical protein
MFVRWQRRQSRKFRYKYEAGHRERVPIDEWSRLAYLVASVRTPAGPRQRNICYLASIREGREHDWEARHDFWRKAECNVRELRVEGADLAGVVAKLNTAVPMPDDFEPGWDEHWRWPDPR